jgi:hypothetical protein
MNILRTIFLVAFQFIFSTIFCQSFSIIGSGSGFNLSTGVPCPLGNSTWGTKHQMLITASELNTSGVVANSSISSLGFNIVQLNTSTSVLNNFTLKVYTTNLTNPIGIAYVTTSPAASSNAQNLNISNTGWVQINLSSSFIWNGTSSLVIETCYNNTTTTTNVSLQNTTLASGTVWTRYHKQNTNLNCSSNYTSSTTTLRPNIRIGWFPPSPTSINSTLSSVCTGDSITLSANGSLGVVYWYSGSCGGNPIDSGVTTTVTPNFPSEIFYAKNYFNGQYSQTCASKTINVDALSQGGISNTSQSICSGTSPSNLSLTGSVGQIQWQNSSDSINWSNISGANQNILTSSQAGNLFTNTYYRAIVTNGSCLSDTSSSVKISILPLPNVNAGIDQLVCQGTSVTLSGSGAVNYAWNGGVTNNQPFVINSTNTFTLTGVGSNNCSNTDVVTIVVNNIPVSGTASSNQTICSGSQPSNLILSSSQGNIQWQSSVDAVNWSNITGATSTTLTGVQIGNLTLTTYYRAKVSSGVCNEVFSNFVTVSVSPPPQPGIANSNQTICRGSSPSNLFLQGSFGFIQWQQSTNNSTWTNISGANNDTLFSSQMGTLTTIRYYRAVLQNSPCTSVVSNTITISIASPPVSGTASANQSICSGSIPSNLTLTGFSGSIQWQYSTNNLNWISISGGNTATLNSSLIGPLNSTTYFRALVDNGTVCQPVFSNVVTITVFQPSLGGIASANQTICNGQTPAALTLSSYLGTIQWQQSTTNLTYTNISGATGFSLLSTQMGSLTTTTYYRAIVKNGVCSSDTSSVVSISVNPLPMVNAGADQIVCQGSSAILSGSGALNYSWTSGVTNNTPFVPSGTSSYSVTGIDVNGCSKTDVVLISVNPTSVGGLAASNQTICNGTSPSNKTLTGYVGTIQWQRSTDSINWSNINLATGATLTSAQMGTLTIKTYYRAIVKSGVCPSDTSNIITVNVSSPSVAGIANQNQVICAGSIPNSLQLTAYTGSIQWQTATASTGPWTNIPGATDDTLISSQIGILSQIKYFRAFVTSGVCTGVYSNTITISINNNPIGGQATNNQTICSGASPLSLNLTSYSGTIQWQSSADGLNWNNIPNTTTATLSSTQMGTLNSTTFYRARLSNGVCSPAYSTTVTISVNQPSVSGIASINQTICTGTSPSALVLSGYLGNIQWQQSTNNSTWSNISGATNDTLFSNQIGNLNAIKYYRAIVANSPCSSVISNTITISISQNSISGTANSNQSICQGTIPQDIILSGYLGSIQWQGSSDNNSWVNINGATNDTLFSNYLLPISSSNYYYRAIVANGSCFPVYSNTVNISTYLPSNAGSISGDQLICSGTSPNSISISGNNGNIQWQLSYDELNWNNINGATNSTLLSNQLGVLQDTAFYRAIVNYPGCINDTSSVVSVNVIQTSISGTATSNQTICSGSIPSNIFLNGYIGDIQWEQSSNISGPWYPILNATNDTLFSNQIGVLTTNKYFRAKVKNSFCSSVYSNTINITVKSLPIINISGNNVICIGNSTQLSSTSSIANSSFSWSPSSSLNSANISNPIASPTSTTVYTLNVVGGNGCLKSSIYTVTVNPKPTSIINNPIVNHICLGENYTLYASTDNGINFNWILNGTGIGTSSTPNFMVSQQGNYSVLVTNSFGCSATSSPISLIVNPLPLINGGSDKFICLGDSVVLEASGGNNYVWSNNITDGVYFYPTISTNYTVSATDSNNCTGFDQVYVSVNLSSDSTIFVSSLGDFTLNGITYTQSGIYTQYLTNKYGCDSILTININHIPIGIGEQSMSNKFKIFPNPSNDGIFNLEFYNQEFNKVEKIVITDMMGKRVTEFNSTLNQINLINYESGSYLLVITLNKRNYYSKLIKN